jgi:hypothetical protein
MNDNATRSARAAKAISSAGYDNGLEIGSAISDLLTDLHHLSDQHALDFDSLLEIGLGNYDDDCEEEGSLRSEGKVAEERDQDDDWEYEEVEVKFGERST